MSATLTVDAREGEVHPDDFSTPEEPAFPSARWFPLADRTGDQCAKPIETDGLFGLSISFVADSLPGLAERIAERRDVLDATLDRLEGSEVERFQRLREQHVKLKAANAAKTAAAVAEIARLRKNREDLESGPVTADLGPRLVAIDRLIAAAESEQADAQAAAEAVYPIMSTAKQKAENAAHTAARMALAQRDRELTAERRRLVAAAIDRIGPELLAELVIVAGASLTLVQHLGQVGEESMARGIARRVLT